MNASHATMCGIVALTALVLLGGALCCLVVMADHDHEAMNAGLCGSLALAVTIAVSVLLGLVGITAEVGGWAATPVAVRVPDPPPWR